MGISVVDIVIVVLVALFVVKGWKAGLVKSVFDLLSLFIVGLLTWFLYPTVSKLLISTPLYDGIHNWITATLQDNQVLSMSIPEFLSDLPGFLKESINVASKDAFDSVIVSTADALTLLAVNAISIIVLFVGLTILSFFVKKLGSFINKIIIIGPVNMILGAAFGFIQGIFICYIVLMVISYFPTSSLYNYVAQDMEKSYVGHIMYSDNVNIFGIKPTYPIIRGE